LNDGVQKNILDGCLGPDSPFTSIIFTSRRHAALQRLHLHIAINPIGIAPDRLRTFLDALLRSREAEGDFDDDSFDTARKGLRELIKDRKTTPLLAKLYTDAAIGAIKNGGLQLLPKSMPELFLHYINELNRTRLPNDPADQVVQVNAIAIAW